jgi:hypothetical protein
MRHFLFIVCVLHSVAIYAQQDYWGFCTAYGNWFDDDVHVHLMVVSEINYAGNLSWPHGYGATQASMKIQFKELMDINLSNKESREINISSCWLYNDEGEALLKRRKMLAEYKRQYKYGNDEALIRFLNFRFITRD